MIASHHYLEMTLHFPSYDQMDNHAQKSESKMQKNISVRKLSIKRIGMSNNI
jgi:hypothetical protein